MDKELFINILQLFIFFGAFIYICALATALFRWLWRKGNKK